MTFLRRRANNACLSDGTLRSAIDNGVDRMPEVSSHLDTCADCRQRLEVISGTESYVSGKMAALLDIDVQADVPSARYQMQGRIRESSLPDLQSQGETFVSTMWKYRAARGAVAMLALVLITTAFVATPMRSLADNLLNRFQVEKFEAITVQMDQFAEFQTDMLLRAFTSDHQRVMGAMETLVEVESTFDMDAPEDELSKLESAEDARAAFGPFKAPGTLPAGFQDSPQYMTSSGGSVTATVDTASLRVIIDELRLPIDSIPPATDMPSMVFQVDIPAAMMTYYSGGIDGHLAIMQMESPVLTIPEGLDMDALREDILSLPTLPADFVEQLRAIDDWQKTLVIPVPEDAETRDVTVNGNGGLLIEAGEFDGTDWGFDLDLDHDVSVVMWNADGILYIVAGTIGGSETLQVANSLR